MNNLHLAAAPGPHLWFLSTHDYAYNAQDGTMRIVRKDVVSGPATRADVEAALCEALAADQTSLAAVVAERDRLRAAMARVRAEVARQRNNLHADYTATSGHGELKAIAAVLDEVDPQPCFGDDAP